MRKPKGRNRDSDTEIRQCTHSGVWRVLDELRVALKYIRHHSKPWLHPRPTCCCCLVSESFVTDRLLCPWDPGKNTGVDLNFLLARRSSQPRERTCISASLLHCRQVLYPWVTREDINSGKFLYNTGSSAWCSGGGLVANSCVTLAIPWTVACQAPLSMGFSRQEYWSGLPFLSPGDLPDLGIKPGSPEL